MSIKITRWQRPLLGSVVALSLLVGCDDSESPEGGKDASTTEDGSVKKDAETDEEDAEVDADAGVDAGDIDSGTTADAGDTDANVDAQVTPDAAQNDAAIPTANIGQAQPKVMALSAQGPDRLCDVTFDAAGNIYAVGFRANEATAESDRELIVAKFLATTGELDPNFGAQGIASKNVTVGGKVGSVTDCQGGGESARAIVLHGNHILIAGTAETEAAAALPASDLASADTDIVIVRFTLGGQVDESFGQAGVRRFSDDKLNTGIVGRSNANATSDSWLAGDRLWSMSAAPGNKFVLHGVTRAKKAQNATAERTDTDFVLIRVNEDGSYDETFDKDGVFTLDVQQVGNTARSATVLADGSIVGAGYMTGVLGSLTGQQQPVLYKVTPAGVLDATFAKDPPVEDIGNHTRVPGVYYGWLVGPSINAEAYGAALQGDKFVTMGYGPNQNGTLGSDVVSFRFTQDGKFDRTYGTKGYVYTDVGGYSDNGRGLFVLPDQRVLGLGGGRPAPAQPSTVANGPEVDALLVLYTQDGKQDTTFGQKGLRSYNLGGTSDFFFNAAVSPDKKKLAVVGYKGLGASANDDSALLVLPLD